MSDNEILSIKDAAELLHVNAQTIYRRVRDGEIPAGRIGRSWRIRRSTIEAILMGKSFKDGAENQSGK